MYDGLATRFNLKILDQRLPVERPDFNKLSNPPTSGIQTTWFGHATVLVQFDGISILTDPVFSERCSPFSWIGGNRRYRPVPCEVEELPKVDIVLISHSHYDHLDYSSVQKLNAKFGDSLHWFVPVGLKSWMISTGCQKVTELSWWKEVKLEKKEEYLIAFTPTQHWSGRSLFDRNKSLWGSWLVKGQNNTFFFAGDTGYCEEFKKIGKKYGPITLAAIPIGAYDPRDFLRHHHVSPEEAVQIQTDVQAKYSLGIHWGTFRMAIEPYDECVGRVTQAIRERKLQPGSFFTLIHGHMATVGEIIIMRLINACVYIFLSCVHQI
ncbi:N-acyl-phosphatidylethanolamine-hydrolyzing phospholipase D-like isoform X2 [Ostrea edulis]|uniref:N-acyl-phosphatidylethanolamine-hydrolyzing phospholipase D-like isoform X2 n=1 Tax=Ostrea edulis TaxID=37623 RepID=UPI0024AE952A|nr:N-acyl-phosphatidylethanolamine-hydrolyzing phospholipase D-like isoform X2 [Ostrea edulis]